MNCTCNSVRCICPTGHPLHRAYPPHCPYSPFNGSHIGIGKVPSTLGHGEALACPSAHATDIETPGGPHGTCAGQHSSPSCIDEKKSKKCAQKHIMSQDVRYVGLTRRSGVGAEGVVVFWQPIAIIASIPVTQRCCIGTLYPPRPRARVHRLHSLWPCRSWSLGSQAQVLVHLRAMLPVKNCNRSTNARRG